VKLQVSSSFCATLYTGNIHIGAVCTNAHNGYDSHPSVLMYGTSPFYSHLPAYEDGTECSKTSAFKLKTPGNYQKRKHTTNSLWKLTKLGIWSLHFNYYYFFPSSSSSSSCCFFFFFFFFCFFFFFFILDGKKKF